MNGISDAVEIWISTQLNENVLDEAPRLLTSAEQTLQSTYAFAKDRRRFTFRRIFRRLVLAKYLQCTPEALEFSSTTTGKPLLKSPQPIFFSASSSDCKTVLAISSGNEVGIDIERIRPLPDIDALISKIYTDYEQSYLSSISPRLLTREVLRLWTFKEAAIKANGLGLAELLANYSAFRNSDGEWTVQGLKSTNQSIWNIIEIPVGSHHSCAVATQRRTKNVRVNWWP